MNGMQKTAYLQLEDVLRALAEGKYGHDDDVADAAQ